MAIIEKREVTLEKDLKGVYLKNFILFVVTIIFLEIYIPLSICSFIFLVIGLNFQRRKTEKFAFKKEYYEKDIFSQLNDGYHVFNDIVIEIKGKRTKLGTIIVGNNGVFIIEIKNVKGNIIGSISDNNIIVERNIAGLNYYRNIYNPYKKVQKHADIFNRYLKMNNIRCHVIGLVFFNNDDLIFEKNIVNIDNSKGLIFDNSIELLRKIKLVNLNYTEEEKKEIISAINISKYL